MPLSDSESSGSYDDESYDVSDAPRTWKEFVQHQEYQKEKEFSLKQNNMLLENENKQRQLSESLIVEDPLGISQSRRKFSSRITEWDNMKMHQSTASENDGSEVEQQSKDVYISQENFSPSLFLATVHKHSSKEDMAKGKANLIKNQSRLEGKMRDLIQNNLAKFIEAKDSADKIYKTRDSKFRDNSLQNMQMQFKSLHDQASELFDPLIRTKKMGEDIKEALALLKKYGFIFNLPTNIASYIEKREYKKVVVEYNKGKFFRQKCAEDLTVFKPIFESVDKQVAYLRELLFEQLILKDRLTDYYGIKLLTDEQEKIIGYLNALGSNEDPAWYYLNQLHSYAFKLFEHCREDHEHSLKELKVHKIQISNMERRWRLMSFGDENIQFDSDNHNDDLASDKSSTDPTTYSKEDLEHETLILIKRLCSVLTAVLPNLWTLCRNILSGKYQHKTQYLKTKNNVRSQSEAKMLSLFHEINRNFSKRVTESLDKIDNGSAHQKILCQCVVEVLECYEDLLKYIPGKFLVDLQEFVDLRRRLVITETWRRTNHEISRFHVLEDWKTVSESQTITSLPVKFQEHVFKTINLLKPFVRPSDNLYEDVHEYLIEAILSFADCLHELAFKNVSQLNHRKPKRVQKHVARVMQKKKEYELLLILTNCHYTKTFIFPDIIFAFIAAFKYSNAFRKQEPGAVDTKAEDEKNSKAKQSVKKDKDADSESFDSSLSDTGSTRSDQDDSDSDSDKSDKNDSDSDGEDSDNNDERYSDGEDDPYRDEKGDKDKKNTISEKEIAKLVTQFQNKEDFQAVSQTFETLVSFVLDAFVRRKATMFNSLIEKGILLSGHPWASSPEPQFVQSFVLELLLELSMTHSTVDRITSILNEQAINVSQPVDSTSSSRNENDNLDNSFTKRIFCKLSERLAEVFAEYVTCLEVVSINGAFQLDINISFVRKALRNFETRRARTIYGNVFKYLQDACGYDKKLSDSKLKEQILNNTSQQTFVQLECFEVAKPNNTPSGLMASHSFSSRQRSIGLLRMAHS